VQLIEFRDRHATLLPAPEYFMAQFGRRVKLFA